MQKCGASAFFTTPSSPQRVFGGWNAQPEGGRNMTVGFKRLLDRHEYERIRGIWIMCRQKELV